MRKIEHKIGVISDTHGLLRPEAEKCLEGSDVIIHAGDIGNFEIIHNLRMIATIYAVRGNVDKEKWANEFPETLELEILNKKIFIIHNIKEADVNNEMNYDNIISGHSHKPLIEKINGILYLNPGSAGTKDNDKLFLWKVIFFSLTITIVIQALLYLQGYYSFSGDESDRTLLAYSWLIGKMPKGEPWLPFHTIINGIFLKYFFNLFWMPRIVGSIFSLLSVTAIIWFSQVILKDRNVTIITAILAVFFPPFVILRAVPLSEVMYFFFIIGGASCLFKWLETSKSVDLIFTALLFAFAGSVRYEGWIFSGSFIIFLLVEYYTRKEIRLKLIVFLSFIVLSFPVFWIFKNLLETGNPLEFIVSSSERYKKQGKIIL
ncbi:MAG: YfcE family phosphodiesterase [Ignavibacteriaceae bacterium]